MKMENEAAEVVKRAFVPNKSVERLHMQTDTSSSITIPTLQVRKLRPRVNKDWCNGLGFQL